MTGQVIKARQELKDGLRLRVVHEANPQPSPPVDVRQCPQDGQQVLILRGGVIRSTLHWESANLLGQALCAVAARCATEHDYVQIVKNARPLQPVHRQYASELGSELQRVAKLCEDEHLAQCARKLGRPLPFTRIFGIPLLESPQEIERL